MSSKKSSRKMTLPSADICQTTVADPNLVKENVLIGEVFEDEYFLQLVILAVLIACTSLPAIGGFRAI